MRRSGSAEELRDEPVEVEVTASETVYEGRVWDVRNDTFRYNGDELVRQYVDHPGAAAIVALDDDDRVLLIQQYRHPIRHRDWEIPAGLLDVEGESPLETAQARADRRGRSPRRRLAATGRASSRRRAATTRWSICFSRAA